MALERLVALALSDVGKHLIVHFISRAVRDPVRKEHKIYQLDAKRKKCFLLFISVYHLFYLNNAFVLSYIPRVEDDDLTSQAQLRSVLCVDFFSHRRPHVSLFNQEPPPKLVVASFFFKQHPRTTLYNFLTVYH